MSDKCFICGEELKAGIDGIERCKNGHEKKKRVKQYTYPLGEGVEDFKKPNF